MTQPLLFDVLMIVIGYLCGSLASAVIVCRMLGLPDPRTQGSGNPGATNVLRLGGKKAGVLTLAGDGLKGVIPVLVAKGIGVSDIALALTALAAFLGHLYPIFFGFRGGKGVATAFGVLLGLAWPAALAALGTWLSIAIITRLSSLSALTATCLTPLYLWGFGQPPFALAVSVVMAVLLIGRHHSNIRNLLHGREDRMRFG